MRDPLARDHETSPRGGSFRLVIPNAITFLGFACGLMAIRAAIDGRLELAIASIFIAICLDGIDGRLARRLNATSVFGAELDSLADCVSFGVAPAIVVYYAALYTLGDFGWVVAILFAAGIAFRLARFNAELQVPRPTQSAEFFVGVPAPAGAAMALLPIVAGFIDMPVPPAIVAAVLLLVTGLCVSRLPVYSGKSAISLTWRNLLIAGPPLFVAILLFPWTTLAILSALFVATLPFGLLFMDRAAPARSIPAE